jgi:hypothetical protein
MVVVIFPSGMEKSHVPEIAIFFMTGKEPKQQSRLIRGADNKSQ